MAEINGKQSAFIAIITVCVLFVISQIISPVPRVYHRMLAGRIALILHSSDMDAVSSGNHSQLSSSKHTDTQLHLPPRSPEDIENDYRAITEEIKPSLEKLKEFRSKFLALNDNLPPIEPVVTKLDALNNEYYFQNISQYDNIGTVFINASWAIVQKHVLKRTHHFASNDCKMVADKSHYGGNYSRKYFNTECRTNVTDLIPNRAISKRSILIGFPAADSTSTYNFLNDNKVTMSFLHVIHHAAVDGIGNVVTRNAYIGIAQCYAPHFNKVIKADGLKLHDEVFSIAQFWGTGFFHVTIEDLPRISPYVDFLKENKNIKIHVNTQAGFLKNQLQLLGIDRSRMISGNVKAKILYLPEGTPCGSAAPFQVAFLSLQLRRQMTSPPSSRRKIVLIRRTGSRSFRYHDNILRMLKEEAKPYNLSVEVYGDRPIPSFDQTLALFNGAFMVVAPHGAGLSNMVYLEPDTFVVEALCLFDRGHSNLCYRNVAYALSHRHYAFLTYPPHCTHYTAERLAIGARQLLQEATKL